MEASLFLSTFLDPPLYLLVPFMAAFLSTFDLTTYPSFYSPFLPSSPPYPPPMPLYIHPFNSSPFLFMLQLPPTPSHPLLQTEVESGYLQSQANQYGYVLAACDWWGMAEFDEPAVIYMMAMNIGDFGIIPERLTQGMLNALLLMKMLKVGVCMFPLKCIVHIWKHRASFMCSTLATS